MFWLKILHKYCIHVSMKNLPKYSEDGQMKYLQKTLSSKNVFILLLVISYVVSRFKLLRMPSYSIMKPY